MNRDAIYSLTAVTVLVVTVISLFFVRAKIMADISGPQGAVMGIQSSRDDSIPLKVGWNYFKNKDFAIGQESEIIEVNGERLSVNEALAFGVINSVAIEGTGQVLIEDISEIPAGSPFEIYVSNINNNPAVILQ